MLPIGMPVVLGWTGTSSKAFSRKECLMSEYQFVHFLAIDKPLTGEQLEFMNRQSSRADISQWEFTNEYHYGDFRGKAKEMLRQGYDLHLHYANFGIRKLMIRLPAGLPCDRRTFQAFLPEYKVSWHADSPAKGGILEIQPEADAGTWDPANRKVERSRWLLTPFGSNSSTWNLDAPRRAASSGSILTSEATAASRT